MLELYTFRVSHFSEKSRWMLDAAGIEYREVAWTPFFHVLPALRRGRRATSVPVLKHASGSVQDSTRILLWLDANMPGFHLLPRDPAQRREALEIEDRCDRVGLHVMRYAYHATLDEAGAVIDVWTLDATRVQRALIARSYPLLRMAFRRLFGIDAARVARAREAIGETLDFLESKLADGRDYLVGDALSAADITAGALLAPLFGPEQHPVYGRADMREAMAPLVAQWQQRPVARWLHRRYREDRVRRAC